MTSGRGDEERCTRTFSSTALQSTRKPPSRKTAIPGSGVEVSLDHLVRYARALSPRSFAQRRISFIPTEHFPTACRIWSGSAGRPWMRNNNTSACRPESAADTSVRIVVAVWSPIIFGRDCLLHDMRCFARVRQLGRTLFPQGSTITPAAGSAMTADWAAGW